MMLIPQMSLVTKADFEPVSGVDMMGQLGMVALTDQALGDALVTQLGTLATAARIYCEKYEKRVYARQTWLAEYDHFPCHAYEFDHRGKPALRLPLPPFVQISSFKYVDLSGALVDLPEDDTNGAGPSVPAYAYQLQSGNETQRAKLLPACYRSWPPTQPVAGAVQIEFQCGYESIDDVPANVLQAIKLLAQFYYENGGVIDLPIPGVVHSLLTTPTKGN